MKIIPIELLDVGDFLWVEYFNDFFKVKDILQNKNNDFAVTDYFGRTFYFMKKTEVQIR